MARKALGRGLGSLIPTQETDVSRETSIEPENAMDIFFPRQNTGNAVEIERGSESRASHAAVTADLLKPAPRHRQKPKSAVTSADAGNAKDKQRMDSAAGNVKGQTEKKISEGESVTAPGALRTTDADEVKDLPAVAENELIPVPGARMAILRIAEIAPNLDQPREHFDAEQLQELADSIKEIGILQPIVVREISESSERYKKLQAAQKTAEIALNTGEIRYELIMGERRLRASQLANLTEIPAIIRDTNDDEMLRDALLENLHRAQLNPIEEAAAYQQLMEEFNCTQDELAQKIKRSRPQISNTIRLLRLPAQVQAMLIDGKLSMGHGRTLLGLASAEQMILLAQRILVEGLSVRIVEEIVAKGDINKPAKTIKSEPKPLSISGTYIQDRLTDLFGSKVTVEQRKRTGKIIVEFKGSDDLERIAALVQVLKLSGEHSN